MTFERMKAAHDKLANDYLAACLVVEDNRGLFIENAEDIKAALRADIRLSKFKIRGSALMVRRGAGKS